MCSQLYAEFYSEFHSLPHSDKTLTSGAVSAFILAHLVLGKLNKHLMTGPKGNSEFCFPQTLNVEVEGK